MTGNDTQPDVETTRLVQLLEDASVPIQDLGPEGTTGDDDLEAVCECVGDSDVVGLGESSHGTREFVRFRDRVLRHLVADRGLRLIGLEADFAAMLEVNAYVVSGRGTPPEVLATDGIHPLYRVEGLGRLLEWLRAFNDGRPDGDSVRMHGFDVQHTAAAAQRLGSFLEAADPALLDRVRDALEALEDPGFPDASDQKAMADHLAARRTVVGALEDAFESREAAYVDATSRDACRRARRLVWQLEQGRKQFEAIHAGRAKTGANVRIRDSAMAAQVQWLRRYEGVDRIAIWGHNAHLARDHFAGGTTRHRRGIPSLGSNLATLDGVEYCAIGLFLGSGSVMAYCGPESEYRTPEIPASPPGSVPDVFGRVEASQFLLDVGDLPAGSALSRWFDREPLHFDIAGGYREDPVNRVETDLQRQFDAIVYIDETSPVQQLAAGPDG